MCFFFLGEKRNRIGFVWLCEDTHLSISAFSFCNLISPDTLFRDLLEKIEIEVEGMEGDGLRGEELMKSKGILR